MMTAAAVAAVGAAVTVTAMMATPAFAMPDLRQARTAGALTVYPDDTRRSIFYYPPGELTIAVKDGAFDVHLLHARYTGSTSTGDRGATMLRSIFSVRLVMSGPTTQELTAARHALRMATGAAVELRPLPIRRLESAIVYAADAAGVSGASGVSGAAGAARAAGAADSATSVGPITPATPAAPDAAALSPAVLPAGHVEETDAPRPADGYWTERVYTLGLDATDAQLLSEALERGSLALSIGYAFLADGIASDRPLEELTGTPELVEALKKQLASRDGESGRDSALHVVRAGAVSVTVDAAQASRIVQRIDINDSAPPGYAALDIYCYDFNQGGESPLYEKQIEIDAAGVGNKRVQLKTAFSRAHPDLFARSLRFPVAVRLDKPYRFRVHAIAQDGTQKTSEWRERASWTELLDVTTVTTTGDSR